ncbi:MAG: hypothetical protein IKN63_01500 [Bacilli bacterium]|nr:hypothetical protein [Bacilli bacterium]
MIRKIIDIIKNHKFIFAFVILFLLLLIINYFFIPSSNNQVKSYISNLGYKCEDESNYYHLLKSSTNMDEYLNNVNNNINSTYEENFFDTDFLSFKKSIKKYEDKIESSLDESFNYKTMEVDYDYKMIINDFSSVVFSGSYNYNNSKVNFTCNKEYAYNFESIDDNTICEKIKYDVQDFYMESIKLFDGSSVLNKAISK